MAGYGGMDPGLLSRMWAYAFPPAQAAGAPDPNSDAARQAALAAANAQLTNGGATPDTLASLPVTAATLRPPLSGPMTGPAGPIVPGGGSSGGGGASGSIPPVASGSGYGDPRLWGPIANRPVVAAAPAAAGGGGRAAIIPASATAQVPLGAPGTGGDPNRWLIDRVNAGPVNQPGRRYQTALDLSGLFGGGAANPANVPAAAAQPVSGGALSKGGVKNLLSRAPWNVGPLQKGQAFSSEVGPFTPDQIAGRALKRRYT